MEERRFIRIFLLVPTLVVLYFFYRIFEPFLMPILLGGILASLFYPPYSWLVRRLGGRSNWAALISCFAITAILVVPLVLMVVQLGIQANQVYQNVQAAVKDPNSDWRGFLNPETLRQQPVIGPAWELIQEYAPFDPSEIDVAGTLAGGLQMISGFLLTQSTKILSSVAHLVTNFFVMIFAIFFLFRDGPTLVSQLRSWTPLSDEYEDLIIDKFQEVAGATVLGSLLTALAQGVAGAIVFWMLGIDNVLLWGSLMALFSLVPVVGTAIVWAPWTVFLISTGHVVKAVILVAAAVLFVGMIDNVLRPMLIEGKVKMHTMLVFFSIMGGISYFGIVGMILGPIVVALGLTFLELYKIEFRSELVKPGAQSATESAEPATDPASAPPVEGPAEE